jgi:hypothetical protein
VVYDFTKRKKKRKKMGNFFTAAEHMGAPDMSEEDYIKWLEEDPRRMKDVDERSENRIMHAARHSFYNVVRLIHAHHHLIVSYTNYRGKSAMHRAAAVGDAEMIRLLHSLDSSLINRWTTSRFYLPIHAAAKHGHVKAIEVLCELGTNVDAMMHYEFYGIRAIELALKHEKWDAALAILRCGSLSINGEFFKQSKHSNLKNSPMTLRLRYVLTGVWPPYVTFDRPTDEEVNEDRRCIFASDFRNPHTKPKPESK